MRFCYELHSEKLQLMISSSWTRVAREGGTSAGRTQQGTESWSTCPGTRDKFTGIGREV